MTEFNSSSTNLSNRMNRTSRSIHWARQLRRQRMTLDQVQTFPNEYRVIVEALGWRILYIQMLEPPEYNLRVWVRVLQYDGIPRNVFFDLPMTSTYTDFLFVGILDDTRTVYSIKSYNIAEEFNRTSNMEWHEVVGIYERGNEDA
jgi:hypothetical protein